MVNNNFSNNVKLTKFFNEVATIATLKDYCDALAVEVFEPIMEKYGLDDAVCNVSVINDIKRFIEVVEQSINEQNA